MNRYGYACINMQLSYPQKHGGQERGVLPITTGRSMIKRTFEAKGVDYASELTLNNVKDFFHKIILLYIYGNIYKKLGKKYGPIDLTIINIGAYDFRPMFDKSVYHTTPEEALEVARDLNSKKVLGMHWGTFVLSLEPIMEPPVRFKNSAVKYGFKKDDALIFKIGQISLLNEIIN